MSFFLNNNSLTRKYRDRDLSGKYIPKTTRIFQENNNNNDNNNDNEEEKESNENEKIKKKMMMTDSGSKNLKTVAIEIRSSDWVDNRTNFTNYYKAQCLNRNIRIKRIELKDARVPSPELSFSFHPQDKNEIGTNEIRYNEGLILLTDKSRIINLEDDIKVYLPLTINNVTSFSFLNSNIEIQVQTEHDHGLIVHDIVYLYDENASGFNSILQKCPFKVIDISNSNSKIFTCVYYNELPEKYVIPGTFTFTKVLIPPFTDRRRFINAINSRLNSINKNIVAEYDYNTNYYLIYYHNNYVVSKISLLDVENWNNYYRIRLVPKHYTSTQDFANELEKSWNPPYTTTSHRIIISDESGTVTTINLTSREYKDAKEMGKEIENLINTTLSWNSYAQKIRISYDDKEGKFEFVRFLPFELRFSGEAQTASLFGFRAENSKYGTVIRSHFQVFYREPFNNSQNSQSYNRYAVRVNSELDKITIDCLTINEWCNEKSISTPLNASLPLSITPVLQETSLKTRLNLNLINDDDDTSIKIESRSQVLASLAPPNFILVRIEEIDNTIRGYLDFVSNEMVLSQHRELSNRGYFGILKKKDKIYELFYSADSEIESFSNLRLDKLTISLINTDGTPFNTENLNHEIVLSITYESEIP